MLRTVLLSAAALATAITLTGCANDQSTIAKAVDANAQLQPAVVTDPEMSAYLQSIGNRIVAAAQQLDKQGFGPKEHFDKSQSNTWMFTDMKFLFVSSKTVNAFTTGGKYMYVYSALFEMCKNEDELAAVMSHEYAHVYSRHVQQGSDRQYGQYVAAGVAGAAGAVVGGDDRVAAAQSGAGYGMAAANFVGMGFTRENENQADKFGFAFYSHAGWDPAQFGTFFQQMIDAGYDTTPGMLSDHPTLKSRVENANRRMSELPKDAASWRKPDIADTAKFAQLVARAKQIDAQMPQTTQTASAQKLLASFNSCVSPKDQPGQAEARQELLQATPTKK